MSRTSLLRKTSRLAASLLLLGVAFSVSAREPFEVIDANGKRVGPIQGQVGTAAYVPFRHGDRRIVLLVHRLGFGSAGNLYFESTDCTGQPYLHTRNIDVLTPSAVVGPRRTLYLPDGAYLYATTHSYLPSNYLAEADCVPLLSPFRNPFRAALATVDLDDLFTPPFRISASPDLVDLGAPVP